MKLSRIDITSLNSGEDYSVKLQQSLITGMRPNIAKFACTAEDSVKQCFHEHKREGTGAIFYHSYNDGVNNGVVYCSICGGWQRMRKGM